MYQILGWINVVLAIIIMIPFALIKLAKNKDSVIKKTGLKLKKIHRPLGGVLFVLAVIHGMLALGVLTLHTGTIVGLIILLACIFGLLFIIFKKKGLFKLHKLLAGIFTLLLIIHLAFPSIFN